MTKAGLSYAFMELLSDGAVVARLDYRRDNVLLFFPITDEVGSRYKVWQTSIAHWKKSKLHSDSRMISLVILPKFTCQEGAKVGQSSISYSVDVCDRRIKSTKDKTMLYHPLPSEDEVLAMIPILWKESPTSDQPTHTHCPKLPIWRPANRR